MPAHTQGAVQKLGSRGGSKHCVHAARELGVACIQFFLTCTVSANYIYILTHITLIKREFQAYVSKPYMLTRVRYCIYYGHRQEQLYNDVRIFPNV